MKYDQHVELSITIKSNQKVSFITDIGWAEELSIKVDCVNLDKAKAAARKYISGLSMAPFQNDACNEGFIDEACEIQTDILNDINDLKLVDGKAGLYVGYPLTVEINFEESYRVIFGE